MAQGGSDSYSPQKLKGAMVTDSQRFRSILIKKLADHLPEIKCYYHSSEYLLNKKQAITVS